MYQLLPFVINHHFTPDARAIAFEIRIHGNLRSRAET